MKLKTDPSPWLINKIFLLREKSIGHSCEHLALNRETSNPRSSSTACSWLHRDGHWLRLTTVMRIRIWLGLMVSRCMCCFPPFDLFISKAQRASGGSEAWAEDWLNMNMIVVNGFQHLHRHLILTLSARPNPWGHVSENFSLRSGLRKHCRVCIMYYMMYI